MVELGAQERPLHVITGEVKAEGYQVGLQHVFMLDKHKPVYFWKLVFPVLRSLAET